MRFRAFSSVALLCLASVPARAEVFTLSLREAVDRALEQNPDLTLTRLDEQKAVQGIRLARDPFAPRLDVGSGLAYTNGYPQSVEGSAPSLINAKANQFLFNRQQTFIVAQARENARGAAFATASKRDEIAFRTASLYLDLDRAARLSDLLSKQVESLQKVSETTRSRVEAGYELPLEQKRALVEWRKAQQRLQTIGDELDFGARSLAVVLGYSATDLVKTNGAQVFASAVPDSESAALQAALAANKDLRKLESAMVAKGLEIKADKAQRLPRVDLVAQYAYFTRFNNLDEYFRRFQKNNEEFGASFSIPLLPGPGIRAQVAQAEDDTAKLRVQYNAVRNQITLDIHQAYQEMGKSQMAKEVAQADLDLARESLTVVLAQLSEGRVKLKDVEQARIQENEKWLAFYDAQYAAERAKFIVLRETGDLAASLK